MTFPLFIENAKTIKYLAIAEHDNHRSIIYLG